MGHPIILGRINVHLYDALHYFRGESNLWQTFLDCCPYEQFDSWIPGCYGKMTGLHSGRERIQAMPILTLAHGIPLWFLVLSLFLPRLSLFVGWIHMWWFFVPQPWAAVLWAFLPRVLVLIFIHAHQGFDLWFWIHLVTAVVVWLASGASHKRRRVRRRVAH
jgi:hypothetical protein